MENHLHQQKPVGFLLSAGAGMISHGSVRLAIFSYFIGVLWGCSNWYREITIGQVRKILIKSLNSSLYHNPSNIPKDFSEWVFQLLIINNIISNKCVSSLPSIIWWEKTNFGKARSGKKKVIWSQYPQSQICNLRLCGSQRRHKCIAHEHTKDSFKAACTWRTVMWFRRDY